VYFTIIISPILGVCSNGDVRLTGGLLANEGRVEFCQDFRWGTVCDDFFGTQDSSVICAQLGFSRFSKEGRVMYTIFLLRKLIL